MTAKIKTQFLGILESSLPSLVFLAVSWASGSLPPISTLFQRVPQFPSIMPSERRHFSNGTIPPHLMQTTGLAPLPPTGQLLDQTSFKFLQSSCTITVVSFSLDLRTELYSPVGGSEGASSLLVSAAPGLISFPSFLLGDHSI